MEQIAKEEQRKAWKLQGKWFFCKYKNCKGNMKTMFELTAFYFVSAGIGEKYTTWEPTKRELELLRHNPKRRKITTNCTIGGQ